MERGSSVGGLSDDSAPIQTSTSMCARRLPNEAFRHLHPLRVGESDDRPAIVYRQLQPAPLPYPWHRLAHLSRAEVTQVRHAVAAIRRHFRVGALAETIKYLLGATATVRVSQPTLRIVNQIRPTFYHGTACLLCTRDRSLMLLVEAEPEFAYHVAATLLCFPPGVLDRSQPVPGSFHAVFGGFCISVAQHSLAERQLVLAAVGPQAWDSMFQNPVVHAQADIWVRIGHAAFGVSATWRTDLSPFENRLPLSIATLRSMGSVRLSLRVVADLSVGTRQEIDSLMPGDVWLFSKENKLQLQPSLHGPVWLMTSNAACAWSATLRSDGGIVAGDKIEQTGENQDQPVSSEPSLDTDKAELLANAPVVVRVEIGSITLSARQWADVAPGDVITTGRLVSNQAILRIAGFAVAEGELVTVEGELGVKIERLLT